MRRILGPTQGTILRKFVLTSQIHPALTALQAKPIATLLKVFKIDGGYCALPSWVSQVQHVPSEDDLLQFDLSPIMPSIIKIVLRKCPSSSSPGDDGITSPSKDDAIYSSLSGYSLFKSASMLSCPSNIVDSCKDHHDPQEWWHHRPCKLLPYQINISDWEASLQEKGS